LTVSPDFVAFWTRGRYLVVEIRSWIFKLCFLSKYRG
jgi:hypothetical protein